MKIYTVLSSAATREALKKVDDSLDTLKLYFTAVPARQKECRSCRHPS